MKLNRWMAVAAATVIALLVGASAATAGSLITSAKIKNGTVKLEDMSSSAKRALKGKTGPQGPAGPAGTAGAQGAQGVQGPNGGFDPAKVTYVEGPEMTVGPGGAITSVAKCPAGMKAVGGGYFFAYANGGLTVASSQYLPDGSGWLAGFANSGSIAGDATAYAVCAAK